MKTKQELFDIVARNLIRQGRPSIMPGGLCYFHGPDNTRCAAGWIIKEYPKLDAFVASDVKMNNIFVTDLLKRYKDKHKDDPLPEELRSEEMISFIFQLQLAHDKDTASTAASWMISFKREMRRCARYHDLSAVALDEVGS